MKPLIVALMGNPNCGKTTLFNALTGCHQPEGNWSGVTVEEKQGRCFTNHIPLEIVDLPGCYGTDLLGSTFDEKITHRYLAEQSVSVIVNVCDATQLERHLYLTLQLLEQDIPLVVAVNMMDIAEKEGIKIDCDALAKHLNCKVIPIVACKNKGLSELKAAILQQAHDYKDCNETNEQHVGKYKECNRNKHQQASEYKKCNENKHSLNDATNHDIKAEHRYQRIQQCLKDCVQFKAIKSKKINMTEKIDALVLNKFLGIPFFLLLIYALFVFTIQLGGVLQESFAEFLQFIFIDKLAMILQAYHAPSWLIQLCVQGLSLGVITVLSFVPVIACMFFGLSILEASGYMSRAAFIMDKTMQWIGLSGKSFVPMILGFGCNVPAILGARVLENSRERILTIMMTPFMSCGARLAIYALFVSAFFKEEGHNVLFALYLIGILIALLTGWILRSTVLKGSSTPLILELPRYQWPDPIRLWRTVFYRVTRFLVKAGIIIVPLCMLFGGLSFLKTENQDPWMMSFGRKITPIFAPMGIEQDNWPATVGLLTGVIAKEVVVGTLNSLYETTQFNMVQNFGGKENAFAYLLFVLLYFPCVSAIATIARELNLTWALFAGGWTTLIAYIVAVIYYQMATFSAHIKSSAWWIFTMVTLLTGCFWLIRRFALYREQDHKKTKFVPTHIIILDS